MVAFPRSEAAQENAKAQLFLLTTTEKTSTHAIASWSAPVLWSFADRRANTEKQWNAKQVWTTTQKAAEDSRTPKRYRDRNTCEPPQWRRSLVAFPRSEVARENAKAQPQPTRVWIPPASISITDASAPLITAHS